MYEVRFSYFLVHKAADKIAQIVGIALEPLQSAAHINIFIAVMKYCDEINHSQQLNSPVLRVKLK